jgi:hypothetical protein
MFSHSYVNSRRIACITAASVLLVLGVLPLASTAQSQPGVKFSLSADTADSTAVDVNLTFNMNNGQQAFIKPPPPQGTPPSYELVQVPDPGYATAAPQGPDSGWVITAQATRQVSFKYKVRFGTACTTAQPTTGEAPGGLAPPRAIAGTDLKAFAASDALLAPQSSSGKYISEDYTVNVKVASGDAVLVPWPAASGGGYKVSGTTVLLSNFMAWGKIRITTLQDDGPKVTAGFGPDYKDARDGVISAYGHDLQRIRQQVEGALGARPDETDAIVLITGAGAYGLEHTASESLRDSFILFHGGEELTGDAAVDASKGWLGLWNGYSLLAAPDGGALWLQEGLPWYYSFRIAGQLGLTDANTAYKGFCGVYADYLTDPSALKTSLEAAESQPDQARLLQTKGASLLAALTVKLASSTSGSTKNIEWFLGELAKQFDGFKGKKYTQVDVSEILEKGTGTSWDRFFTGTVDKADLIPASDFSTTDIFGAGGVVGGTEKPAGKGSGKNWIYLAVAILVIFSIPFIFSTYIKRSVKLDVSMPRILPDWEEEDKEPEKPEPKPAPSEDAPPVEIEIPKGNPVGEAITEVEPEGEPEPPGEEKVDKPAPGDGPESA